MTQHIIEDGDSITIINFPDSGTNVITRQEVGPVVIRSGNPGIPGAKGDPPSAQEIGALVTQYLGDNPISSGVLFTQNSPLASWTIPNTLGRLCAVDIFVDGELVLADVTVSNSQVVISFPQPTAGVAVLT